MLYREALKDCSMKLLHHDVLVRGIREKRVHIFLSTAQQGKALAMRCRGKITIYSLAMTQYLSDTYLASYLGSSQGSIE